MPQRRIPLGLLLCVLASRCEAARNYKAKGPHATRTQKVKFGGQTIEVTSPVGSGAFPVTLFVPGVTLPCSGPSGFAQTIAHVASHGQHVVCTPRGRKVLPDAEASEFIDWFQHVEALAQWTIATPPNPLKQRLVPRLGCIGHSAGAGMCHALAAYRSRYVGPDHPTKLQISALVLLSPVCGSLQDCCYRGGDTNRPFGQGFACSGTFAPVSLTTEDYQALQVPMLIVSGNRDNITPQNLANAIYDQQRESPVVLLHVPQGTHCLSDPYSRPTYDPNNPHCGCAVGSFFCTCVYVSQCEAGSRHNAKMLRIVRDASSAWMHNYLSRDALEAADVLNSAASAVWNLGGSSTFASGAKVIRGPALSLDRSGWVCKERERRKNKLILGLRLKRGAISKRQSPGRVDWNALLPRTLRDGDGLLRTEADTVLEPMVPPIATALPFNVSKDLRTVIGAEAANETLAIVAGEGWIAHDDEGDNDLSLMPTARSVVRSSNQPDPIEVNFVVSAPEGAENRKPVDLERTFKSNKAWCSAKKNSPTCSPGQKIAAKGYIVNKNDGGTVIRI